MQIVTLFIQNSKNELLIQKRSIQKNGKYGITSGHIEEDEEVKQGLIREAKEELGIDIEQEDIKLFYCTEVNEVKYNLFYLKKDIDIKSLNLQKEEVESVNWYTLEEVEELVKNQEFFENHIEALDIFENYIKGGTLDGNNCSMGCE